MPKQGNSLLNHLTPFFSHLEWFTQDYSCHLMENIYCNKVLEVYSSNLYSSELLSHVLIWYLHACIYLNSIIKLQEHKTNQHHRISENHFKPLQYMAFNRSIRLYSLSWSDLKAFKNNRIKTRFNWLFVKICYKLGYKLNCIPEKQANMSRA